MHLKNKLTFTRLTEMLKESSYYTINDNGKKLLQKYYQLVSAIEASVMPVITPYIKDVNKVKKEIAIQIISSINSQELGTEEFEVASRLDTLTSGGKQPIDMSKYVFNKDDKINYYIEIMQ